MEENISRILKFVEEKGWVPRTRTIKCNSIFELLVITIISQVTNWKNVRSAYNRIKKICDISPESISCLSESELEEALKPAGLYNVKAKRIKELAHIFLAHRLEEKLRNITDPLKAREILLSLPGVGYKTADIILAFCLGFNVLAIDTHIRRITIRLGIASSKDKYDDIKTKLESLIPPEERKWAHLALIEFGRRICTSRNPKCELCPISTSCPSAKV